MRFWYVALPSLMEKRWRTARPSNKLFMVEIPIFITPAPLRINEPCNQFGIVPEEKWRITTIYEFLRIDYLHFTFFFRIIAHLLLSLQPVIGFPLQGSLTKMFFAAFLTVTGKTNYVVFTLRSNGKKESYPKVFHDFSENVLVCQ